MKIGAWLMAAAVCGMTSAGFAQVKGTVTLDGDPPAPAQIDMSGVQACAAMHAGGVEDETYVVGKKKELANVLVSLKPAEGAELKGEKPKDPVKVDQKGCQYHPHVAAVMVGQDLVYTNSDNLAHNVHGLPEQNKPFNFPQNLDPKGVSQQLNTPERFKVKCEVHPWMSMHIGCFDHPFFAVTKADGTYEIPTKGLANGTYTVVFWHEALGEKEQGDVEVKDGKATVDFKFPIEAAMADPAPEVEVKLASAEEECKTGGACCAEKAKAENKTVAQANELAQQPKSN